MFSTNEIYEGVLTTILVATPLVFILCFFKPGKYGKYAVPGEGRQLPVRQAWLIMELPALVSFLYFYSTGRNSSEPAALLLLSLWVLHYGHRALVYPFQIKVRPGATNALRTTIEGASYCALNGFINGYWIGHLAQFDDVSLISDSRLWLGVVVFCLGFSLNKHSDLLLIRLRENTDKDYDIPTGGAFRWVSFPNYLGEILTWLGFAIACWSLPALSFLLFTCANLIPRATMSHRWYREKFIDYPVSRRIIFPYVY